MTVRRRSARWASAVAVAGAAVMACSGLAVAGSAHISGVTLPSRVGAARTGPAASTAAAARATLGVDPSLRRRKGPVTVMVELDQLPAATAYARAKHKGHADAVRAFRSQAQTVLSQQRRVQRALSRSATRGRLLFGTHALYAGVAVTTDASRLAALANLPGVKAIHPLSPKRVSGAPTFDDLSKVGAPEVWQATGNVGDGVRIGVIDTGIDYTHADFGGPGTAQAYTDALADDTGPPSYPDPAKVSGGYDFAGDAYDATAGSGDETPVPDDNPLDCNGHGSHVSGTAAGLGVDHDGDTFAGPYDQSFNGDTFRIRPGVAPGATIVPLKVFGCGSSSTTDLVVQALDWAADPNQDGDPADHLDVVNLSLGAAFTSPQDPDAVAADRAVDVGMVVVAAAGNDSDVYDAGGSPGNAPSAIAVAAADPSGVIPSFSSRGVRGLDDVKPDITAPGTGITSVAFGTGNVGIGEDGTSMATPHVAGAAALVKARYPGWPAQRIKAALMDTAASGVQVETNAVLATAPPMRAGTGLVQADQAISTSVLAYSADDPDAISLSFGPIAVAQTTPLTVTKNLHILSMRSTTTSYSTAFVAASMPAGVTVSLPGRVIVVPANQAVDLPVTLTVDPAKLKLTPDPSKTMADASDWNTWIAEASGWVVLSPRDGRGPDLRVSLYAAPRRASIMAAATSAKVTTSSIGTGTLALSGTGFGSGVNTPPGSYGSLLSTAQLQANSGRMPACSPSVLTGCLPYNDAKAADIHFVGTSSDVPYCNHGGQAIDICLGSGAQPQDALVEVALSTWGAWRSPVGYAQFYVWWDIDGDGVADAVTSNARLSVPCENDPGHLCMSDQLVAQTFLPCHKIPSTCALYTPDHAWQNNAQGHYWADNQADRQPLNAIGGSLDTSPYDSDAMVLPVSLNSLERAGWDIDAPTKRVSYWVTSATVDTAGADFDSVASSTAPLTLTVDNPALSAVGDLGLPYLNSDKAGSAYTLKIRQNTAALLYDLPAGTPNLLLIHHDNLTGSRAQIVPVKRLTTATLTLSATSISASTHVKATVTISPSAVTGIVSCKDGSTVVATATASAGKATCTLPLLSKGSHTITAVYAGNLIYAPDTTNAVTLNVS
ncbi:MAG: S8 family serine peptidase [Actinomycetales bacterium]